jgi:hypothetical protein
MENTASIFRDKNGTYCLYIQCRWWNILPPSSRLKMKYTDSILMTDDETHCLHLQEWRWNILHSSSGMKMEALCSSETLKSTYKSILRYNSEDEHRQFHRRENLIARSLPTERVINFFFPPVTPHDLSVRLNLIIPTLLDVDCHFILKSLY